MHTISAAKPGRHSLCMRTLSHASKLMFSILTGIENPPAHLMLSSTPARVGAKRIDTFEVERVVSMNLALV